MNAPTPPSREAAEFTGRIIEHASGMMIIRLCAIGERLGLFRDLAEHGSSSSQEMADRLGFDERYLREWLYAMASAGYLDFDKSSRKAGIPEAHIPALVEEGGPLFQGGLFRMMSGFMEPYEELLEAIQKGGGIAYSRYGDDFWQGLEHNSCVRYKNLLVSQWLPEMPDVRKKLEQGGSFADFGCGAGRSSIELAKQFPRARFYGFDIFPKNIEKARNNALQEGVSDRVEFQVHDISKEPPGQYDVVATFDLIHDMADPKGGLAMLRKAVRDDGIYVLMDIDCTDDPVDNRGPLAVFKLGASLHFCMTTSLAQKGMGLGTVGLPPSRVEAFCREAGFSTIRRLPIEHPLNALYEIRP